MCVCFCFIAFFGFFFADRCWLLLCAACFFKYLYYSVCRLIWPKISLSECIVSSFDKLAQRFSAAYAIHFSIHSWIGKWSEHFNNKYYDKQHQQHHHHQRVHTTIAVIVHSIHGSLIWYCFHLSTTTHIFAGFFLLAYLSFSFSLTLFLYLSLTLFFSFDKLKPTWI